MAYLSGITRRCSFEAAAVMALTAASATARAAATTATKTPTKNSRCWRFRRFTVVQAELSSDRRMAVDTRDKDTMASWPQENAGWATRVQLLIWFLGF